MSTTTQAFSNTCPFSENTLYSLSYGGSFVKDRAVITFPIQDKNNVTHKVIVLYNSEGNTFNFTTRPSEFSENINQIIKAFILCQPSVSEAIFANQFLPLTSAIKIKTLPVWTKPRHFQLISSLDLTKQDQEQAFRHSVKLTSLTNPCQLIELLDFLTKKRQLCDEKQKLLGKIEELLSTDSSSGLVEYDKLEEEISCCEATLKEMPTLTKASELVVSLLVENALVLAKIKLIDFLCESESQFDNETAINNLSTLFSKQSEKEIISIIEHINSKSLVRVLSIALQSKTDSEHLNRILSLFHHLSTNKQIEVAKNITMDEYIEIITFCPQNLVEFCECVNLYTITCRTNNNDKDLDVFINMMSRMETQIVKNIIFYMDFLFLKQSFEKNETLAIIGLQVIHHSDILAILRLMALPERVKFICLLTKTRNENNCINILFYRGCQGCEHFERAIIMSN